MKYRVLALSAALCLAGCAVHRPVKTVIPAKCIKIQVTNFKKPCRPVSDSLALCDDVEIHYTCVKYTQ